MLSVVAAAAKKKKPLHGFSSRKQTKQGERKQQNLITPISAARTTRGRDPCASTTGGPGLAVVEFVRNLFAIYRRIELAEMMLISDSVSYRAKNRGEIVA